MKYIITVLIGEIIVLSIFIFPLIFNILFLLSLFLFFWILREPKQVIYICILLSLVPLCMGKYFGKELHVAYFLIPSAGIVYVFPKLIQKNKDIIYSMKSTLNPLWVPIVIYFAVVFANFLRQPIFLGNILEISQKSFGIHAWMGYLLSFCYYFIFAEIVSTDIKITQKAVRFLRQLSFILSVLGVVLVYLTPLQNVLYELQNLGVVSPSFFSTGGVDLLTTHYRDSLGGYHIGTLSLVASMGLFFLFCNTIDDRRKVLKLTLGIFFVYALILSGMRSFFAGALLATLVWVSIKRKPKYLVVFLILFICVYLGIFVFYENLPISFQRAFRIKGSFRELDIGRAEVFSAFLRSFLQHPLFGVGIGSSGFRYSSNWFSFFINEQLRTGGHGTYFSLLYLFGLAGFLPFMVILIQGVRLSWLIFFKKIEGHFEKSLAMFCFLFLIFYITTMAVGGSGGDPLYFAIIGIISGLWIRKEKEVIK